MGEMDLGSDLTYCAWCIKCQKSFVVSKEKIENFNPHSNHNDLDPNEASCTGDVVISDNEVTLKNAINWLINTTH